VCSKNESSTKSPFALASSGAMACAKRTVPLLQIANNFYKHAAMLCATSE